MKKIQIILMISVVSMLLVACTTTDAKYKVYVPNAGDGTISVYNTETKLVEDIIRVGDTTSHGIALDKKNNLIYSGDLDGGVVSLIDISDNTKVKSIEAGERIHGIDISPDGQYVLVSGGRSGGPFIAVIDTVSQQIIEVLTEGMEGPTHISFAPDGLTAYVADPIANRLIVVDMESFSVTGTWETASTGPQESFVSPDASTVYVANYEGGTISVIDTESGDVLTTVETGQRTHAVTVSPDGRYIWAVSAEQVVVLDKEQDYAIIKEIDGVKAPNHLTFSPDGNHVMVSDTGENKVVIFDAEKYTKIGEFNVGETPHEIEFVVINQ